MLVTNIEQTMGNQNLAGKGYGITFTLITFCLLQVGLRYFRCKSGIY